MLRFGESLGEEIASELHPDKRTGHFQRLYTFANLRKSLFHMSEIRTCPTSQHLAASQPKRKRKGITKAVRMPQLLGEVHRIPAKCQPAIDISEQRRREC